MRELLYCSINIPTQYISTFLLGSVRNQFSWLKKTALTEIVHQDTLSFWLNLLMKFVTEKNDQLLNLFSYIKKINEQALPLILNCNRWEKFTYDINKNTSYFHCIFTRHFYSPSLCVLRVDTKNTNRVFSLISKDFTR